MNRFSVLLLLCLVSVFGCKQKEAAPDLVPGATGDPSIDGISAQIAAEPNNAQLYYVRGELFYNKDSYDEAIADLNKAISLDSTQATYYHLLADSYLDYVRSREALETMEYAAELFPQRIPTLLKLSEFQLILTKYEDSMRTIDRILRQDPQNADAYFMFGLNFKEIGDTARAINSFKKSVEIEPDLADAWISLGQLYGAQGDPVALSYFDNAIRTDPNNPLNWHAKADYLSDQNDLAGAIEVYQKIMALDPQYEEAYFNAGLLYLDLDSIPQAKHHFNLAINIYPLHIRAYYYRGLSSEILGDSEQAKADYEQALQLAPDYEKPKEGLDRLQENQ